ncbi:RdgB/HAM1 family non-canonical purine NTP pyrophosphatase [Synechococcus sp. CS-1328]|uniref:RdgB/HAM1 family non-canonical purine NTP pyrophosphatase n=1 Tax=Synechococcus sp. CS-1328 TaxID=2847976 RepID=UPI00223B3C52|nr:RdgB/HAM1 family non-canonical purine NTP pyrophosphatase [Synechococcus sp. CS-1328]MCT0223963.1 RdgB/HAM1 family non-canonical purine NTP pyrophosphatase [Synechococcus sp. CS-1328]
MAAPVPSPTVLVIASGNAGKLREFTTLLGDLRLGVPLEVRPQPQGLEVEETGTTFAENARLKAEAVARATGHWALADDSGLSVLALGGAPGVYSARYAATDAGRIERLLRELAEAAPRGGDNPDRRAHFTAALALADPAGRTVLEVEGVCEGEILPAPRGSGGFGYDPVFLVPELGLTFAEMVPEQKRQRGHRGRALAALLPRLAAVLKARGAADQGRPASPMPGVRPPATLR